MPHLQGDQASPREGLLTVLLRPPPLHILLHSFFVHEAVSAAVAIDGLHVHGVMLECAVAKGLPGPNYWMDSVCLTVRAQVGQIGSVSNIAPALLRDTVVAQHRLKNVCLRCRPSPK